MFEDITRASHRERREMVAEILANALYQLILQGRGPRRPKDGRPPAAAPVAPPPRVEPRCRPEPEAA
jgi:hypothetical protein